MKYGFVMPMEDTRVAVDFASKRSRRGGTVSSSTLDQLSNGRVILTVGATDLGFAKFGEAQQIIWSWAEAGATWWIESVWDALEERVKRLRQEPPPSS